MAQTNHAIGDELDRATFLRDDPNGVLTESLKRRVQKPKSRSYTTSINPEWAENLGIDATSAPTSHYFVTGAVPVVVTEPAIVIQPNGGELDRGDE